MRRTRPARAAASASSGISLGGKKSEAYLAVDVRVVNATTGEVDFSRTVEGRTSGGGVSVGVFRGGFGGRCHRKRTRRPARPSVPRWSNNRLPVLRRWSRRTVAKPNIDAKERKRRDSDKKGLNLD